jgi:putative peptidoglycan lipid II flippase
MTINRKIAKASLILILASCCGHVLSLLKEMLVAFYFGIASDMDALYAAMAIPTMLNNVLLSTFGAVFIPIFVRYRLKDKEEANHIASVVINYLFLLLVCVSILLFLFAPWIVEYAFYGFADRTSHLAVNILRIMCVTVVLSGIIGMIAGVLNASEHFSAPAFSQMCITVSTIAFILFRVQRAGVYVIPYGMITGLTIQMLILIPVVMGRGYQHFIRLGKEHPAVREMFSLSVLFFLNIIAMQMNTLVDKIMASYLAPGSIAALGYADKLVQVPIVIFSASLATAVFPFFSAQAAQKKMDELGDSLAKSIRLSGFIFFPLTIMLVILARPLIQVLFQRGAFDDTATDVTTVIFICYCMQLFFFTVGLILARVYLVFQDVVTLIKMTCLGVVLNIVLNLAFMKLLVPPAAGIALATSVVYLVTMSLMLAILRKKMIRVPWEYVRDGLKRVAACSVVGGAVTAGILAISRAADTATPLLARCTWVGASALAGGAVFILGCVLLRLEEPRKAVAILLGRTE